MAVNDLTLEGRIGSEPVLRFTQDGKGMCRFRLVHTRRGKNEKGEWVDKEPSLWIGVTIFGRQAEQIAEMSKGFPIVVIGRLDPNEWIDKDSGQKRTEIQMVANQAYPVWNAMNQLGVHDEEHNGATHRVIKLGYRFSSRDRGSEPRQSTGMAKFDTSPFE